MLAKYFIAQALLHFLLVFYANTFIIKVSACLSGVLEKSFATCWWKLKKIKIISVKIWRTLQLYAAKVWKYDKLGMWSPRQVHITTICGSLFPTVAACTANCTLQHCRPEIDVGTGEEREWCGRRVTCAVYMMQLCEWERRASCTGNTFICWSVSNRSMLAGRFRTHRLENGAKRTICVMSCAPAWR